MKRKFLLVKNAKLAADGTIVRCLRHQSIFLTVVVGLDYSAEVVHIIDSESALLGGQGALVIVQGPVRSRVGILFGRRALGVLSTHGSRLGWLPR